MSVRPRDKILAGARGRPDTPKSVGPKVGGRSPPPLWMVFKAPRGRPDPETADVQPNSEAPSANLLNPPNSFAPGRATVGRSSINHVGVVLLNDEDLGARSCGRVELQSFFKYDNFIRTSQIDDLHSVHKSRWCCLVKRRRSRCSLVRPCRTSVVFLIQ